MRNTSLWNTQSGERSRKTEYMMVTIFVFTLIVVLALMFHTQSPYVWSVNYIYKSNYYQKFVMPIDYDEKTQGREWANWHVDEKGIQKMCDLFNNSMGYFNTNRRTQSTKKGLSLLEQFIIAFLEELEKSPATDPNFQGFPWGNNWYQFTISAPTTMAYYIVLKDASQAIKANAAKVIQYLIRDPQHSLGYERDKANSAMMLLPYTLSHLITDTLDTTNESYRYAIEQYNLAPNENLMGNEDGVHLDSAYLTHNGVYAYGYLWSIENIYPDTQQIIPEVKKFNLDTHMDRIYAIFKHKTVPFSGCTLWKRDATISSPTYNGKLKTPRCVVVPSMRYIRIFGENYQYSAKSGQGTVAFYENDHVFHNMGLYSCFCRKVFTVNDIDEVTYNTPGFILPEGATELTDTPTLEETTTKFMCSTDTTGAPQYNGTFVFCDENWGILYQNHVLYSPLIIPDDVIRFDETILIDVKNEKIYSYILTLQNHTVDYIVNEHERHTTSHEENQIYFELDLKTQTYSNIKYSAIGHSEEVIKKDIEDHTGYISFKSAFEGTDKLENKSFIIYNYKTNQPLTYCPRETEVISREKVKSFNGKQYTFKFDETVNQYVNTEVRIGAVYDDNTIKYSK